MKFDVILCSLLAVFLSILYIILLNFWAKLNFQNFFASLWKNYMILKDNQW